MTSNNTSTARRDSPIGVWFKSSRSKPNGNECVEVCFGTDLVYLRDSKDRGAGPVITIGVEHWVGVLAEALGHADAGSNQAVRIEAADDGSVQVHAIDSNVVLAYTRSEWAAFVAGAAEGEFDRPGTATSLARSQAA